MYDERVEEVRRTVWVSLYAKKMKKSVNVYVNMVVEANQKKWLFHVLSSLTWVM